MSEYTRYLRKKLDDPDFINEYFKGVIEDFEEYPHHYRTLNYQLKQIIASLERRIERLKEGK